MDLYIYKNVWWIVGKQTVVLTHLKPTDWFPLEGNIVKCVESVTVFCNFLRPTRKSEQQFNNEFETNSWCETELIKYTQSTNWFVLSHIFYKDIKLFFCTRYKSTQAKFNLLNMSDGSDSETPFSMSMSIYGDTCKTHA